MLKRLKLTDFKKHRHLEVEFTEGMNLITGKNYQGKSSLLQGVLFCLFGYGAVPGGKAVAVNDEAKSAGGELDWVMSGRQFAIVRKGTNVTLLRDGEEIAKGATPVAAELEKLFGMSGAEFRQLKVSAQKETEALLTLGTAKLHAIIEDVSKATVVNQVIDLCKVVETECKGGLDVLPVADLAGLKVQVGTLAASLKASNTALEKLKTEQGATAATLVESNADLAKAVAHNTKQAQTTKELQHIELAVEQLNTDLAGMGDRVATLAVSAATLPVVEADLAEAREAVQAEADAEMNRQDAQRQLTRNDHNLGVYNQKVIDAEMELGLLPDTATLDADRVTLAKLALEHTELHGRYRLAKHAMDHAECPTCLRALEGMDPGKLKAEFLNLDDLLANKRREHDTLAIKVKAAENALVAGTRLQADLETARAGAVDCEAALAAARAELAVLGVAAPETDSKAKVKALEAEQTTAKAAAVALEQVGVDAKKLQGRLDTLLAEKAALPKLEKPVDAAKLEKKVADLQAKDVDLRAKVAAADGVYREGYSAWQSLSLQLKQAEEHADKRSKLETRMSAATQLKKFLASNRDRYLAGVWDGVMAKASAFASACTEGYIASIQRAENGDFSYVEQGVVRPIDAGSGAQRSIMGLGVQLALADLLPCPLDTLLLDEPTADADPQHSLAMASMLAAEGRQMLMVSHRELDGAVAQNVVEVAA